MLFRSLRKHYHEREANLARDPVAVYAQAKFEPDEVYCYQQLNDWVAGNSEVVEVFPEYATVHTDLLAACEAVYHRMCVLHPHDGGCGWDTDNPLPTLLRDAINKAKAA